jgi:hypothetical protein
MNVLIVEGKDDVAFIKYLIQYIGLGEVEVNTFTVDELGGFSEDALTKKLKSILKSARSANEPEKKVEKIGIILDLDLDTEENGGGYTRRLDSVNRAIKIAFSSQDNIPFLLGVNKPETFSVDDYPTIEIVCHFIGVNGKGELEDFLRSIRKIDSPHADCLDSWNCCLHSKGFDKRTDKEINKLWVHYYLKYDAFPDCSNSTSPDDKYRRVENIFLNLKNVKEVKEDNASPKKLFSENKSSELFDFEKNNFKELDNLKTFLNLFKSE